MKIKVILYSLFVATVLLISGFARAEGTYQTQVPIGRVQLDQGQMSLVLAGSLPSPCYSNPAATLIEDTKRPNTLIVKLYSSVQPGTCIAPVKPFTTSINLPTLVHFAQVNVEDNEIYTIRTDGYEFEMNVRGADLSRME